MRGTNTTNRLGTTYDTRENEMACFDALPPPLRDLVRLNATNLSAGSVLNYLGSIARQAGPGQAVAITARKLVGLEANEISVFAGEHKSKHGYDLPHMAARASVLRYNGVRPSKRRRLPLIRGFGLADTVAA